MRARTWMGLVVLLVVAAVLAVALGAVPLSPHALWRAVQPGADSADRAIVLGLRLPRMALAGLVGAALGMSGGALQGTMRNPLAEPYLLGVSGGAAVGAVVAITLGGHGVLIPLAAFAGAVGAVAAVLLLARSVGGASDPRILVVAGVMVGAFANAAIMVALASASADTIRGALWWMMGSVATATWWQVAGLAAVLTVGGGLLLVRGRELDVLALGGDAAAGLGLDVDRAARRMYLVSALLAAATVSVAGLVGFVGLIVPHLVRAAAGGRHRPLLGASALAGAVLVIAADLLARTLRAPVELPLGAITALAGVPFFFLQMRRLA
ncbi:MAG TPA: iron ABC transporter permease [Gemmatimonadaceae bacterium]|nr:iron ABC transporter permease [Gemmatimonadaceae bacterium]